MSRVILNMKRPDPTTKALQDIAKQLKRIADYMEQHPETIEVAKAITNVDQSRINSDGNNGDFNILGSILKQTQSGTNNQQAGRDNARLTTP